MAQNVVIRGVTYSNVPAIDMAKVGGGTAVFNDTTDATATAEHIVSGDTAYVGGEKITGSMPDNGATVVTITNVNDLNMIPEGYHNGLGTCGIMASERAKIITGNIKAGVSILGVSGKASVVDTAISSGGASASDIAEGKKAYVNGTLVNGTGTSVSVTQDPDTYELYIV